MTQEQIDNIRERMCDGYCKVPDIISWDNERCDCCPLDELEAEEETV